MSTTRRNFLKHSTMVAVAASVPLTIAERLSAATAGSSTPAGTLLSKAEFEKALNTRFSITAHRSKVSVKLIEVQDLGSQTVGNKEAFSLMFRGDSTKALAQDTYIIEHERLGTFSFLLVPMRRDDRDRMRYEAVINRLH